MLKKLSLLIYLSINKRIFTSFVLIFTLASQVVIGKYTLINVNVSNKDDLQILLNLHLDFESSVKTGDYLQIIVNESELKEIRSKNLQYQILIDDYENYLQNTISQNFEKRETNLPLGFQFGSMGGFYKLDEIYQQFDNLINQYPEYFVRIDTIGQSWEERPIIAYSFGNSKKAVPEVLITALHHSREPGTVTNIIYFLTKALNQAKHGNREFQYLFENYLIWFVPAVNPDGYVYNAIKYPNGGGLWRKNRRKINDTTFGVDLNRNYGPYNFWNAPNNGSSTNPKNETYRGPSPFSEPETQAIRDFTVKRNFKIALNFHTYGGMLIYPYSAINKETPDSNFYQTFSNFVTNNIGYFFGRDITTVGYPTRGSSDDWFYQPDSTKGKVLAFTVESGYHFDGFWPPIERIIEISEDNFTIIKEAIFSATANIRPETLIYTFDTLRKIGTITLKLVNIGIADLNSLAIINLSPLLNHISIDRADTTISNIPPGTTITLVRKVEIPSENFVNGTKVPFEISINFDGLIRKDTLYCRLYEYRLLSIFESTNWVSDNWGYEVDSTTFLPILCDSPYKNYSDSTENRLTLRRTFDLTYNAAELEIIARWEIEPIYDFFEIEVSTDNGNNWESLKSNRSMPGSGNQYGKQKIGRYGFAGIYPFWTNLLFDLNNYLNKKILLRLSLLSDKARNYDGISFKKIQFRLFDDVDFSFYTTKPDENKTIKLILHSEKLIDPSQIQIPYNSNPIKLEVYDILGNIVESQSFEDTQSQFICNIKNISSKGMYLAKVVSEKFIKTVPILIW
ncbi:MAG: M14 family zinc carboxypeptidase [Candidatus Kapaibacteriales bacterium]